MGQKWRVIIFDIPEKRENASANIVSFQTIRLYRLQDSVGFIRMIVKILLTIETDFGGKDVLYLIVDEIENDRHLKEEFHLI